MKHIIQIHLEHKKDVIREIEIPSEKTLKDLHYAIIKSLDLEKNEMASFYMTNEEFDLIKEIPLFEIDEKEKSIKTMDEVTIDAILNEHDDKLIYIYDFLKMWRFLISFIKTSNEKSKSINITNKEGEMPKETPELVFEPKKEFNNWEQDIDEDIETRDYLSNASNDSFY